MWQTPIPRHGIPREAVPNLILDPAFRHGLQRLDRHLQALLAFLVAHNIPYHRSMRAQSQQSADMHGRGKLRRAPKPAKLAVEPLSVMLKRVVQDRQFQLVLPVARAPAQRALLRKLPQLAQDALPVLAHLGLLLLPHLDDLEQDVLEGGAHLGAGAVGAGPVGAAEDGLEVGGDEDVEGPAAAAAGGLLEVHVLAVDVRALLAIELDGDEVLVEQLRDARVRERLGRHHVAPVARRVPDAHEQQPVRALRQRDRLGAPELPGRRVAHVRAHVGALAVAAAVDERDGAVEGRRAGHGGGRGRARCGGRRGEAESTSACAQGERGGIRGGGERGRKSRSSGAS
nr:hypothetical protein CFP56_13143 [Quercus suber]